MSVAEIYDFPAPRAVWCRRRWVRFVAMLVAERRAAGKAADAPHRFAYLPFGVGPRVCIGAHFAAVEATLALANIVGSFRVTLPEREPVIPVGVVTTQPDRSPMFRIVTR